MSALHCRLRRRHLLLSTSLVNSLLPLLQCARWLMLELSQVAKVSRLELAQFELYSARVREFEVWGRQSHPRTDGFGSEYARTLNSTQWQLLGNFTGAPRGLCSAEVAGLRRPLLA